jgi:hypothetical protein
VAYGLSSVLGEVVGRDEAAGDTLVETSPSVVGGVDNGVLEAAGIGEVQVKLAVLAFVCSTGARANVGLECIESISNDLYVL